MGDCEVGGWMVLALVHGNCSILPNSSSSPWLCCCPYCCFDAPLTKVRPVKKVALAVVTGDRGLCGGFNNQILKKAENRMKELKALGIEFTLISVGKKGNTYFTRRPYILVDRFLEGTNLSTAKEAQAIADDVFSLFVSEEVDKVELLYTKFVVKLDPVIHTLIRLSPKGEICDINGICVDAAEDEFFRLTTKEGKLTAEQIQKSEFSHWSLFSGSGRYSGVCCPLSIGIGD
ncbi:unnamed protein product [Linum trigynum]|uniref:F-ATPase gamma subunit n=1 Tax=Linum trigynum TaxID=586398 RepID=A0AAV2GNN2_9ROSI